MARKPAKKPAKRAAKSKAKPKSVAKSTKTAKTTSKSVDVSALVKRLNYLEDRLAIHDTINRYPHAMDRHDWELLDKEVYHPDGVADHGGFVGGAKVIAKNLEPRYLEIYTAHQHMVANHICEISGNTAHTETYVVTYGVLKEGGIIQCTHARYIDRLEKRNGKWKILVRRIITDGRSKLQQIEPVVPKGKWDKTDPSYQRPLQLPPDRAALIGKS